MPLYLHTNFCVQLSCGLVMSVFTDRYTARQADSILFLLTLMRGVMNGEVFDQISLSQIVA